MTLREKTVIALQNRGEPMTYRELSDLLWSLYPELKQHHLDLYGTESKARQELRIQLGSLVKKFPHTFTATMSDGRVLVGLAVSEENEVADVEIEAEDVNETTVQPSVYWYTFPAYQKATGPYPIKIGRGADPLARIRMQVTAMPEQPIVLGTHVHEDPTNLERALHSVLILRGKRKTDAPGTEWFMTTPAEIDMLIKTVLG